jgi:hypothetical protein
MTGEAGWAVLQTVIVAVIVVAVAVLAVPLYASGARQASLQQNASTLRFELGSYLAQGLDPTYVAAGAEQATDSHNAAAVFTRALSGPRKRSAYYVNPFDGSRQIVCTSQLPAAGAGTPPAVWITGDQGYAFDAFKPSPENTARLRGTLVVVFLEHNGQTSGVDIYYVDGDGQRSPTAGLLAL